MKKILVVLATTAFLLPACGPYSGVCPEGPVDYSEKWLNHISTILCPPNDLCGKKRHVDWDKEGRLVLVGRCPLFFQVYEKDTFPLGMEHNRFYLSEISGPLPPVLFSAYNGSEAILRIALKDNMDAEERNNIYEILSKATYRSDIAVRGAIRFYKSKNDPYFSSRHEYLPELVISSSNDFTVSNY